MKWTGLQVVSPPLDGRSVTCVLLRNIPAFTSMRQSSTHFLRHIRAKSHLSDPGKGEIIQYTTEVVLLLILI